MLVTALFLKRNSLDAWASICDKHLYQFLAKEQYGQRHFTLKILFALCGLLIILTLSGLSWQKKISNAVTKSDSIIVAIDLSSAISAEDLKPSRIERAKYKLHDLFGLLKESEVGLIAYSKEAFVVSPLTTDINTLKLFIPELSPSIMPAQGNNMSAALKMAESLFKNAGKLQGNILLMSAGVVSEADIALAHRLYKQGFYISVLGIGTKYGAPVVDKEGSQAISKLDKNGLMQLAKAGGGSYQTLTVKDNDIKQIIGQMKTRNSSYQASENKLAVRKDNGHALLFLIVPLFLLCFRKQFMRGVLS